MEPKYHPFVSAPATCLMASAYMLDYAQLRGEAWQGCSEGSTFFAVQSVVAKPLRRLNMISNVHGEFGMPLAHP